MDSFKTVICTKSLTAFHQEVIGDNYFLIGIAGQNAATLAGSKKWLSIDPFTADNEGIVKNIEEICLLFIENYQVARLRKNPDGGEIRHDDIIESLGILWVQKNGKSVIYQAGKCKFITVKMNGYTIEPGVSGVLNSFDLRDNDRLILDLKDADLANFLKDFHDRYDAENNIAAELENFNYPFSLTFIKLEKQIFSPVIGEVKTVIEPIAIEIIAGENSPVIEKGSDSEFDTKEGNTILIEPKPNKSYLIISVFLILSIGILISYRYFNLSKNFDNPERSEIVQEDPIFVNAPTNSPAAGTNPSQTGKKDPEILPGKEYAGAEKRTAHSSFLIDADFALKSANENLRNGKNQQALIQLEKAEKSYLRYLSATPSEKIPVTLKLDEIRQKKSLIKSETDF